MNMENKNNYNTNVYIHRNSFTNEIFYVGIGSRERSNNTKQRSIHWKRYFSKYGRTVHILFSDLSWKEACQIEVYLIAYYGRVCDSNGPLINKTIGGDGASGVKISEETRAKLKKRRPWNRGLSYSRTSPQKRKPPYTEDHKQKIRDKVTGLKRSKDFSEMIGNLHRGKSVSAETRLKLRDANLGKKISPETLEKYKNRFFSDEHRARLSEKSKARWAKIKEQKTS